MATLCTIQNLTLTYPHKTLFKAANLTISEGDKIGVLGLNGHGKSSLFKILVGDAVPDPTVPVFTYDKSKDYSVFMVPQELPVIKGMSLLDYFFEFHPNFKAIKIRLDQISADLTEGNGNFDKLIDEQSKHYEELEKLGEDRVYKQYQNYLRHFGITDFEQDMTNFSGGEQRKVALSLGLSAPQSLILWDEPTNHLDLETIALFEDELLSTTKAFMLITHDRSLLNNIVDRIVHIQHGNIRSFKGTYFDYLIHLQEAQLNREKNLDKLNNLQKRETAWIRRGAKARRTKSKKRIEDYGHINSAIAELKALAHKKVSLNLQSTGRKTKTIFEAENLGLKFGEKTLFSGLNFMLNKGDKIAILGKNGVGKSSLLKIIMGELTQTSGKVTRAENLNVGFFSQKRENLPLEKTPWQLVGEGIDFVISNTGEKRHVTAYLENFLFSPDEIKRPIKTFSGGEKNRLQLAKFMKDSQDIWIFDEPTNDLDLETIGILEEELKNYQGTLLVVGHDRTFIENVTDKCWLIHDGTLEIFEGGLAQAEAFLEAEYLETKLKQMDQQKGGGNKSAQGPKEKRNYAEQERYKVIQKEIEAQEKIVDKLKHEISNFDYSSNDKNKKSEFERTTQKLKKEEHKLDQLFSEWESLESKTP